MKIYIYILMFVALVHFTAVATHLYEGSLIVASNKGESIFSTETDAAAAIIRESENHPLQSMQKHALASLQAKRQAFPLKASFVAPPARLLAPFKEKLTDKT